MKKYYDYVRRLGQWHLFGPLSKGLTLCGLAMLSANRADNIPEDQRDKCKACFAIAEIKEGTKDEPCTIINTSSSIGTNSWIGRWLFHP